MTIYLHAKNDNWAISERKKIKVNLRTAVVDQETRNGLSHRAFGKFKEFVFLMYYQPIKRIGGRRKYKAMYPKGGIFVTRPPTRTQTRNEAVKGDKTCK